MDDYERENALVDDLLLLRALPFTYSGIAIYEISSHPEKLYQFMDVFHVSNL